MTSDVLYTRIDGDTETADLALRRDRPIGWATIADRGTLAGHLGQLGAERVPRRYPVHIADEYRPSLLVELTALADRSPYFDRAWIFLNASTSGFVALLARHQFQALAAVLGEADLILNNGRLVRTVDPHDANASSLEYQGARYVDGTTFLGTNTGELILGATPSSPYADLMRNRHSYYCVLHPSHRRTFPSDYLTVRNMFIELDYPELHAAVPVRVMFDQRVPTDRIVLDSTTLFSIGLPQGEPVAVSECSGRASRLRNSIFGSRHAIARVGRTAVIDIEKPVTRLPEEMFDLLGVGADSRVIIEAVDTSGPVSRLTRTSLRGLPWRDRSPLLDARSRTGVPDIQQLVGDEDFPEISLDLATRNILGVSPGAAVYVRPAVSSALAREFTAVSFILVAAFFSAAALQSMALAVISVVIYLGLTLSLAIARLR